MLLEAWTEESKRGGKGYYALPMNENRSPLGCRLYLVLRDKYGTVYWRLGPLAYHGEKGDWTLRFELGRFHVEYQRGWKTYKEHYVGPEPSTQESSRDRANWKPFSKWGIARGTGRVLSKEWWRIFLGHGYIHARRKPVLWSWTYYNGRWSIDVRWRSKR